MRKITLFWFMTLFNFNNNELCFYYDYLRFLFIPWFVVVQPMSTLDLCIGH
jgi:hypothetical protein